MSGIDTSALAARGRTLLGGFTTGQKAVTAIALAGAVLGGVLFMSWASKPSYAALFTNLSPTDASAITAKLDETKEPYQLADGGGTILVPRKDLYQQRINLSGAGLPAGGAQGYSLLDKQSLTTSEFQQHVTYQRALEGEMSKTIDALDGVDAAVVHLAVPEQDVFTSDASKPSASVLVKTRPGVTLSPSQVTAIVHLVSSSVPDLTPAAVTVADSSGRVLNTADGAGGDSLQADGRAQQTQSFEKSTADAVQSMLDRVVGPGHAVVRVVADLNYDEATTNTERYVTDKTLPPLSVTTSKEKYTGNGAPVGGVLGPDNIAVPTGTANGQSTYSKDEQTQTNAVGTMKQVVKSAPGQVRRLSVAVVLDERVKTATPSTVSSLVAAAAGVDRKRGDTVEVTAMPFDTSASAAAQKELAAAAAAKKRAETMSLAKTAGIVIAVVLLLLWLVRRGRVAERTPVYLPAESADEALQALLAREQARELEAALVPAQREALEANPAHLKRMSVRSEIGELIEQQPDEVARLLRGWLADRRP